MSAPWIDATDDELGALLSDLGAHLEPGGDLAPSVASRIERGDAGSSRRMGPGVSRWLVAAVVLVVALLAGVLAVAPAREAMARWLGIGAVRIETGTPGAAAPSSAVPAGTVDRGALERSVPFPVRLLDPAVAGDPLGAELDADVSAGLVEVRYREVSLVEIASAPGGSPALGKVVGAGTDMQYVEVRGMNGFWLTGDPHDIAYLAADGSIRNDTVRRAGNVLLWAEGAVTYRIEGAPNLDVALELAASLR